MKYFSSVGMPIHWAEFYDNSMKCQEEKDTLIRPNQAWINLMIIVAVSCPMDVIIPRNIMRGVTNGI
jgi:hypothetical protein